MKNSNPLKSIEDKAGWILCTAKNIYQMKFKKNTITNKDILSISQWIPPLLLTFLKHLIISEMKQNSTDPACNCMSISTKWDDWPVMFGVGIEMDNVFGLNVTGLAKMQVGAQKLTCFFSYNFLFHHCMAMNLSQFVHKFCFVNLFQPPSYNRYKLTMMTTI